MIDEKLTIADYPLAERRPHSVKSAKGMPLDDFTLEALADGRATMEDLRTTPEALLRQASIARHAGREKLAANFERAAEMTAIPQKVIMEYYEMLRPGRVREKQALLTAARRLRDDYHAHRMATFVEEAAEVYERRGLFKFRF